MATREAIIQLRLEDKDASAKLGQLAVETRKVNDSIKLLNSIIDENGKANTNQARQLGELIARKKNLSGQTRELSNDLSGLTAAGMRFRDKMADATLEAIKQSGILGQLSAKSETLNIKIVNLKKSYTEGNITMNQYNQQNNILQQELNQTTVNITKMEAQLERLNKDFKEGNITAEQFKAGVASVNAETQKVAGAFSKGVGELKNYALGMVGVVAAVQGLRAIYSNVTGIIADFDKAQSRLAGILGTTKDGMAALTEQAKELGATTAFTASQVTDAQTELAKLGFTQNEIIASTGAVLNLARAAGADLSQAAEVTAATLNAFGLEASEAQRVTDVMSKSFSTSALDIDKFTFAMRVVAPVAKNAGISIEETTALIGVLADNGVRAETSGTGLRNILGKLAQTGMTFNDAMTRINTSTDKTKTAIDLFGLEASTVAIVLADNTEQVNKLKVGLDDAAGSTKALAEAMDDNLIGDKLKLTSAWEGFVISLDSGDGVFSRVSRNITTGLADILNYLTLINSTPDPFGDIGEGKGSAVKAERATKAYREELEKLIEARAEEQGWKDKSLATSIALRGLEEADFNRMRERTTAQLNRVKTLEDVEAAEKRVADALAKSGELLDKSGKTSLKTGELLLLQRELQAKKTEILAGATAAQSKAEAEAAEAKKKAAEAAAEAAEANTKQAASVRVLTDELRAFIAAQKAIESGVGIGQMRTIGGIGSQSDIGTPESRLLPGDEELAERTAAELESIEEVRAAQAAADAARQEAMQQTFNMLTSLGQLAKEGSAEAKVLAVAQAITGAYLAIINALATFDAVPDPTGAVKFAKVAAISAAAFSAVARVKSAAGFEEGGYTPRASSNSKPVGVVHANEYVVPARMVQDPRYSSLIEQLEKARRGMGFGRANGAYAVGGMVGSPRPSSDSLQAIENANIIGSAPIFVRVEEINQVQGRVARATERSTL
jgi:hypothetical protein